MKLRNACLCSHLRFWRTGARSSCPGFDSQLMTVNILRLHRQFINRIFDRTGLSKATRVIVLTMGLSCPWLHRVFV